jgi:hypothetical protein
MSNNSEFWKGKGRPRRPSGQTERQLGCAEWTLYDLREELAGPTRGLGEEPVGGANTWEAGRRVGRDHLGGGGGRDQSIGAGLKGRARSSEARGKSVGGAKAQGRSGGVAMTTERSQRKGLNPRNWWAGLKHRGGPGGQG